MGGYLLLITKIGVRKLITKVEGRRTVQYLGIEFGDLNEAADKNVNYAILFIVCMCYVLCVINAPPGSVCAPLGRANCNPD